MSEVFLLDIGSGKLDFIAGNRTDADVYNIRHFASCSYDGYYKSEFLNPDSLLESIKQVIFESGFRGKIRDLYIGVPADFCLLKNNFVKTSFKSRKTISDSVLDEIYALGNIFDKDPEYDVINSNARLFVLDNNITVVNPINKSAQFVSAYLSYVLCKKSFCDTFKALANAIGAKNVSFISSFWASCVELLPEDARESGAILCDIGFCNMSFGVAVGSGLDCLNTKSLGSVNLAGDIMQLLDIPYSSACSLLKKINLFINSDNGSCYNVIVEGKPQQFNSFEVNQIVEARIDDFVRFIEDSLAEATDYPSDVIYITGGGLSNIKGAVAYLSRQLGRRIELVIPDVPTYAKAYYSSAFATFNIANKLFKSKSPIKKITDLLRR